MLPIGLDGDDDDDEAIEDSEDYDEKAEREILKLWGKSTKTKFVWICEPWKQTFLAIVSR